MGVGGPGLEVREGANNMEGSERSLRAHEHTKHFKWMESNV